MTTVSPEPGPQPVPQPQQTAPPPSRAKGNASAITGFSLAIVALFLCLIPIVNNFAAVLAILGLIFGIVGLVRSRRGRPYRGLAIASVVLAVVAFGGVIASQALYSSAIDAVSESVDEVGSDIESDLDEMSGEATDEILKSSLTVDIGSFDGTTDELGFAEGSVPVKLTSKADEAYSYDVYVEAVDSSGDRIAEDWASSSNLKPGQSESFDLFALVTEKELQKLESAEFRVVEVSRY